jgi:hypothetical protein
MRYDTQRRKKTMEKLKTAVERQITTNRQPSDHDSPKNSHESQMYLNGQRCSSYCVLLYNHSSVLANIDK